jgi:hypothetical protein
MTIINRIYQRTPGRSALQSEITTSVAISTNLRWTTASWNTFSARKTEANAVNTNLHATQAQIDAARLNLYNARVGLVLQAITLSFTGSWSGQGVYNTRSGYCCIYGTGTLSFNTTANNVEWWVLGGGAGGGGCGTTGTGGSGGGGGGYCYSRKSGGYDGGGFQVLNGDYAVYIGGGGAGGVGYSQNGGAGGRTWISQRYNGGAEWFGAAGGAGGTRNAGGAAPGGAGGSGGGGGQYYTYTGQGGQNGASGTAGQYNNGTNAGGAGSGRNMHIFQESSWWSDQPYGSGGGGGCHNDRVSWMGSACHAWAGTSARNAAANTGCGGGGIWYGYGNNGTAGGSGAVWIRWYD